MQYAHAFNSFILNEIELLRPETKYQFIPDKFIIFLLSSYISVMLIKKLNKKIVFYGDSRAINFLKKIEAPYDEYHDISSHLTPLYSHYWSYAKIKSMQLIDQPTIFLDWDMFLYVDILNLFDRYDVLFETIEPIDKFYTYIAPAKFFIENNLRFQFNKSTEMNNILDQLISLNKLNIKLFKKDFAFRCSFLGFKDIKLAKDYSQKSIKIYDSIPDVNLKLDQLNKKRKSIKYLPTFPEQFFLKKYVEYNFLKGFGIEGIYNFSNKPIFFHTSTRKNDPEYVNLLIKKYNFYTKKDLTLENFKKIILN